MYKTGDMVHILDHALPNAPAEQQAALRGQIGKLVDQVYADGELSLWLVQVVDSLIDLALSPSCVPAQNASAAGCGIGVLHRQYRQQES
jgi:hypothetical protein